MATIKFQIPNHKIACLPVVTDLTFGLQFESPWKFRSEIRELFGNWSASWRMETGNSRLEGEL